MNTLPELLNFPELLNVNEAARILAVKPATIRAWIRNGELRAANINGQGKKPWYRIPREEIEQRLRG